MALAPLTAMASDLGYRAPDPSWLQCKWSKKDPLKDVRAVVAKQYATATDKSAWVDGLRKKRGSSTAATTRYLLACYLLKKHNPDYSLDPAYQAAMDLHAPSSREAARARFLVSTNLAWTDELCRVGEQLLKVEEDFDVRYELVRMRIAAVEWSRSRYELALKEATKLAKRYPSVGKVHSVSAALYYCGLRQLHIEANRAKALTEYRLYLTSRPPECSYVRKVRARVKQLESNAATPSKPATP